MSVTTSSQSAAERPIHLRARPDLEFCRQAFGGHSYWAVKDPVALRYFHLRDEEHALLTMLDGHASPRDICRRLESLYAPRSLDERQLQQFLANLHRRGLLLGESPAQGAELLERHDQARRRKWIGALVSILAIRLPGVNPQKALDWLAPVGSVLFSRMFALAGALMAVSALLLVMVQFDTFRSRLPELHAIVAASNLPWLMVALAGTKILHELGHALACRRFGADCHEVGLMLLVFTPCLYCNVSDSWMLPSKWRRIAIAGAGIYVELILASACTFLWWFSQPGLFNSLCLDVMIICSMGTLVFNGNPLLRYDGYFILSDLVEVPNLKEEATQAVERTLDRVLSGRKARSDRQPSGRRTTLLVLYALASVIYRAVVVVGVLWGLNELARRYRLEVLVIPLACVTAIAMLWPAAERAVREARNPSRGGRRVARTRGALAILLALMLAGLIAWLPLPMWVAAPLVVEYRDAESVYVTMPGRLTSMVRTGERVESGQPLAVLTNPSIELELTKMTADRDRQHRFLSDLEARRLQGTVDGAQIPPAAAALADASARLDQLEQDAKRLTLRAPIAGTVLPPPNVPRKPPTADNLDHWAGVPLDPRNSGAHLDVGTQLCLIGDPRRVEAVLNIGQSDVELVETGQPVRMVLDHLPDEVFVGRVDEIARLDLKVMPRELAASEDVPSRTDPRGVKHPLDTWYQARVSFDELPSQSVARVSGRARITVTPRSLGSQLTRWLKQTFSR
jgi:putative peptide zinc metalloprotease protein